MLVALAAALATGCGGGRHAAAPAPERADASGAVSRDRRSPDNSAALIIPGAAHGYACDTHGTVEVRFDPAGSALVTAGGRVLAFANLDIRVVRRDCRLLGPPASPSGAGIIRSTGRTAITCPSGPVVRIDLRPLAAPFWGSDLVVADVAGRRLIASALLARGRAARGLYRAATCER